MGGVAIRGSRRRSQNSVTDDMKEFLEGLKPELELCEENEMRTGRLTLPLGLLYNGRMSGAGLFFNLLTTL